MQDELISRQSAIFLASDLKQDLPDDERIADMVMAHNEGVSEYQTQLSLLPPVNPAKTGHWVYKIYGGFHEQGDWYCSKCDYPFNYGYGHAEYCPKCGCEMSETPTEEVIGDRDYDWVTRR